MGVLIRDLTPWFANGLMIEKSGIHGLGLFASECFDRDSPLLRFGGTFFSLSDRTSSVVIASTSVPICEGIVLAEPTGGEKDFSDFINHSCDPNVGFSDAVSLVAMRRIRKGEEITIDYAFWESDPEWKLKGNCTCHSSLCRRIVTGRDWLRIMPTEPRVHYFSPFLQRRILGRTQQEEKCQKTNG